MRVYLFICQAVAIFLFARGFLLSKLEISDISISKDALPAPRFKRSIIVLVDALRFDFCIGNSTEYDHYTGKLSIVSELLSTQPQNTILFKSYADPPTTTMQRLKALVTGGLPTFIEAGTAYRKLILFQGANFAKNELSQDNIISKLKADGRSTVFMGDDTWTGLFPSTFSKAWPFDSFDVWDLHTLDNSVKGVLFPLLKDTYGTLHLHMTYLEGGSKGIMRDTGMTPMLCLMSSYGPNHPEMALKLTETSHTIQSIIDIMDDDTLLFVIGDHGMDEKGDHGGDSELETTTAMLVYAKSEIVSSRALQFLQQHDLLDMLETSNFIAWRSINQIDFTPTFAALLGLEIPFGSVGYLIPELFAYGDDPSESLLLHYSANSRQLLRFVETYSSKLTLPDIELSELIIELQEALILIKETEYDRVLGIERHAALAKKVLFTLRRKWAQFNLKYMSYGIVIMMFASILLVLDSSIVTLTSILLIFEVLLTHSGMMFIAILPVLYLTNGYYLFELEDALFITSLIWLIPTAFTTRMALYSTAFFQAAPLIIFFIIPFSDSFTINETSILTAIIQVATLISVLSKQRNVTEYLMSFVVMCITRLYDFAGVCRVEQGDFCDAYFYIKGTSHTSFFVLPVLFLMNLSTVYLNNQQFQRLNMRIGLAVGFVASLLYWSLDTFEVMQDLKQILPLIYLIPLLLVRGREDLSLLLFYFATIVQKPVGAIMMHLMYAQFCMFQYLDSSNSTIAFLVGLKLFFSTGHQFTFTSVMWDVGFIGIKRVNWISVVLVALNTVGGIFATWSLYGVRVRREVGIVCMLSMIGCAVLRTHHKVWAAFTPRMCYYWVILVLCWGSEVAEYAIERLDVMIRRKLRKNGNNKID